MSTFLVEKQFPYGSGSHFRLKLYYDISQNINENYSDVTFSLDFVSQDGYSGSGASTNGYINSNWVGSTTSIGVNTTIHLGSRTDRYYHNSDGTGSAGYSVEISSPWGIGTAKVEGSLTLPTIPRASQPSINTWPNNSPDFNIGDTITIHMNRKAKFTHKVYFVYGNTSYLVAQGVTNNCTFDTNLVASDLYDLIPSSNVYSNVISVQTYSGNTLVGTKTCNYNARVVNANPIFSDFEIEDVNSTTLALTGDSSVNVRGYSNTQVTISSVNKATAQKGASMIKYRYSNGDKTTDINYSDSDVNGTINGTTSGTHNVYAIDSRNNTTLVTKLSSQVINYENIFIDKQNSSLLRNNSGVGSGAILTLNGSIWNNSFGLVTNSITNVSYKLKKTDSSTWINGTTTITPTIGGNTFTFTGLIASDNQDTTWDLDGTYNVQVIVEDELSSYTIDLILNSAVPTISLDKNGVGIMCAYDSSLGEKLQVDGKIIDGGTLLWENTSPTADFVAQTITLNSDNYDIIDVFFCSNVRSNNKTFEFRRTIKNYDVTLSTVVQNTNTYRVIKFLSDNSLSVGDGYSATEVQDRRCVPLYIIGYKTNLFN